MAKIFRIIGLVVMIFVIFIAWVVFIGGGCTPPQPQIDAQEVTPEQQALMDQIDEMGMAADGKEFIAAPPTFYEEMQWEVVRRKERNRFQAEMKLRQKEDK